jgi:hypothetical protein
MAQLTTLLNSSPKPYPCGEAINVLPKPCPTLFGTIHPVSPEAFDAAITILHLFQNPWTRHLYRSHERLPSSHPAIKGPRR